MNASGGNVVDSKIVELQFQNQNFESNAKTSLSTIERLKKALNFSVKDIGAFDTISRGVSTATEHTHGLTNAFGNLNNALGNIRNVAAFSMIADEAIKAKNAVESFVKSVSLDPISQGWQKYADKTEAVQTIMAATKEDFSNTAEQMKVVNEQLEKLNWFTDETSYNFVDMVDNIGKFTANRIPLDQAVTAMEGISTWAAISGQKAQSASRAMYNLAQAIGVGAVKLIDWRSVENANMGTAEFKQTVIETAESMKLLTKTSEDTWKTSAGNEVSVRNFTDALKDEWFTSEVLVKTLEKYGGFTDKLHGYMQEMDEDLTTSKLLTYIDEFKAGTIDMDEAVDTTGVSADRLKEIFNDLGSAEMEFGRKAFVAAQQAVTFEQAIDAVKDAASTAWMNTFEIMFGDFEQAKTLWTDLSENLWDVFVGGISETNDLLEEAFNKSEKFTAGDWDALKNTGIMNPAFMSSIRKIAEEHGLEMDKIASDEEAVTAALEKGLLTVQDIKTAYDNFMTGGVGDFDQELLSQVEALQESDESFKSLIETVGKYKDQDLSKVAFGDGEYSEEARELEASIDNVIKALGLTQDDAEKVVGVLAELGVVEGSLTKGYAEMTEEELKTLGWSEEQIAKFVEMRAAGEDVSKVLEDIGVNPMSGGDHWLNGLYNIMDSMLSLIDVFQKAWGEVFPKLEADSVYQALVAFDEGTASLTNFIETSDVLKDSFKAIASVVSLVVENLRMIGEGIALKGIIMFSSAIAGAVVSFVKLTGTLAIGASIFEFASGLISGLGINIGGIVDTVAKAITAFAAWAKSTDIVNKALSGIHKAGEIVGRLLVQLVEKITGINLGDFFGNFGTKAQEVFGKVGNLVTGAMTKFDGFVEKVKALGGVSIDNFLDVMKLLKGDILEYLSQFKGFQNLKKGFEEFKENAKNSLAGIGINVDDFTKKFDTIKSVFGTLGNSIQTRFSTAFTKIQNGIGSFAENGKEKIQGFIDKVKSMGGIKLDNIIDVFGALKTDVLDYFANWEGFTEVKTALTGVWDDLAKKASEFGVDLSKLNPIFNTIGGIATKVFNKVKSVGGSAFKVFSSFGLSTAKSFGNLYDKLSTKVTPFMTAAGERISSFVESLGSMDSISLDSISGLFKGLWDDITTYFSDVDIVQMLKDSFSGFWDQMRQNLKDMGLNLDWLVDIFETIGNVGLSAFGFIRDGVMAAIPKVQELWNNIAEFVQTRSTFVHFQEAFTKISDGWGEFVSGAGGKFSEFIAHVKELGGVSFDNLGTIFDLFKEDVLDYFANWEGFGAIRDAFSGIWEDIKAGLADYGINIDAIEAKIVEFVDNVKAKIEEFKLSKPFEKFLAIFTGGKESLANGFKTAKSTLSQRILDFFEAVKEAMGSFELPEINSISDIFSIFSMTTEAAEIDEGDAQEVEEKVGIIQQIIDAVVNFVNSDAGKIAGVVLKAAILFISAKKLFGAVKKIGDLIKSITGYFDAMAADANASARIKKAASVVLLAVAIGILAKSIIDITKNAKQENLWPAVGVVAVLAAIVLALQGLSGLIPGGGIALGGVAATIGAFALLLKTLNGLDWDSLSEGFGKFGDTLAGIDVESIDTGKIVQIAGVLDTMATAGLKNSIGSAIQEFAGIEAESSLTLLADSLDDLGVGLEKFVNSLNNMNLEGLDDSTLIQNGPLDKVKKITGIINDAAWGGLVDSIGTAISYPYTAKTSLESYSDGVVAFAGALEEWTAKVNDLGEIPMPTGVDTLVKTIDSVSWSGLKGALADAGVRLLYGDVEGSPQTAVEVFNQNLDLVQQGLHQWRDDVNDLANIPMPTGVDDLIKKIGTVSNEGVFQAIDSWSVGLLTGGESDNSVAFWKTNVETFSKTLNDWSASVNDLGKVDMPTGIDELNEKLKTASKTAKGIAGDSFTVTKWFGDDALPTLTLFNLYVDMFATALNTWKERTNELGDIDVPTGIDDLIKKVDKASEIGAEGSLKDAMTRLFTKWFGGKSTDESGEVVTSMTVFSQHVGQMADALVTWDEKTGDLGNLSIDKEGIDNLIEAVNSISADGGLFGAIESFLNGKVTEQDYIDFGDRCGDLGTAVQKFQASLGDSADLNKLTQATEVLSKIGEMSSYFQYISSDQNFALFTQRLDGIAGKFNDMVGAIDDMQGLNTLGMAAAGISAALNTITSENIDGDIASEDTVDRFVSNLKKLKEAIEELNGLNTGGVDKLNEALTNLGDADVAKAEARALKATADAEKQIGGSGTDSVNAYAAGMSDTSGVSEAAGNVASAATEALSDTSEFATKGTEMITAFTTALSEAVSSSGVGSIVQQMTMEAIQALENGVQNAGDYGGYFASGFANGISMKAYLAREQAAAMARAAAEAVKSALSISSPSKVTYEYGRFFGEGFGNAIEDYSDTAYKKASILANTALDALGNSLNVIDEVFASEDIYEPLIRPVVDTSEIQNGAAYIGQILSSSAPIDLTSNVKGITYSLDARRQATSLDDVVSALGLVEKSTSSMRGGDTYNVNGITYDDGTNVAAAVKTLVRAVKIDRRT